MNKKLKNYSLLTLMVVVLASCSTFAVAHMTSDNMNKLELGMTKQQVTAILSDKYTISEQRIENNEVIQILSYRDFYSTNEYYLFQFRNNRLEKWHRELLPTYETTQKQ